MLAVWRETTGGNLMKRRSWLPLRLGPVGGLLLALLILSGSGPTSRAAPVVAAVALPADAAAPVTQGLTPVRVGMQYLISDAGVLLADERGYFREVGIDMQGLRLDNLELQTGLSTGQVEAGGIGPTAALLNAVLRGVSLRMVADRGTVAPGYGYIALVVRKDLVDGGQVRQVADLRGRKIAGQPPLHATPGYYLLERVLASGGLAESDVEFVGLGFADQNAALLGRTIDAAWQAEPGPTVAVETGLAVRFAGGDEAVPNFDLGVLAYSEPFAAQTDLARRFMVAYLRGVRVYLDAFTKNVGREAAIAVLTRETALRDAALYDRMRVPYMNPDGAFSLLAYPEVLDYYVRHGVLSQPVDFNRLVDNSFADYAAAQLGPYR
jgi:NitT/TauT family transport system substrate-binding protein